MKYFCAGLLLLGVTSAWADTKVVPNDVLVWYKDTMGMYTTLVQGLDQAKDAKATAKALNQATATVKAKKLAARYRDLETKYPQFFADQDNSTWVPPAEWIQVSQDYAKSLQNYGTGLQKAMTWMQDPTVAQAFQDFGEAMGEIGGGN